MSYVDGFVIPVPTAKLEDYWQLARLTATIWREHGALEYRECVADDVKPGKLTSFPQSVLMKDDETVIFAWVVYQSREHRDEVMAKVMADPRFAGMKPEDMPFDGQRMFFGGFKMMVSL